MKNVTINSIEYEIIEDYKNGYDKEAIEEKLTDYFEPFDYIVGDWAYGKLRLKGFCDKTNSIYRKMNDIQNKDTYLKNECAYECKYFVLKKNQSSKKSIR